MSTNRWAQWLQEHDTDRFQLSRKAGWDAFVNSGPRPRFDVLTRGQMDALDEEALEDYNEARCVWNANLPTVKTQQLTEAFETLDQVMSSSRRDGDRLRGGAVIDAEPGLGKTTIASQYARTLHRREYRRFGPTTDEGHQRLPVAFVPLSARTTLKGLNQQILEFYGHPGATRATRARLTSLAIDCVTSCATRLIIIDDLHFVDFKHRNGLEVSNHLKSLANVLPVTFLYVGVNLQAKRFFDEGLNGDEAAYAQTARRATRCAIAPFAIGTDSGARAWIDLLATLERHIMLADAQPGMLVENATEIYRRTQGRIASLTNLIDRACYTAITNGVETINEVVLAATLSDNAAERLAGTA